VTQTDPTADSGGLRQQVMSAVWWVAIEKWGARFTQFVVFAILARLLEPRAFGLAALAYSIISITTPLVDQGLSKAVIQREDLEREHRNAAFWTAIGLSLLVAAALALLAGPISAGLGQKDLAPVLRLLALTLPIGAIQTTPASLMERSFEYKGLTIRQLIGVVGGGIVGVVLAFSGAGVYSLVWQAIATAVFSAMVLWRVSDWRPQASFSVRHFKELWGFGINVLGIEMISLINQQSDRFIVGAALGPTALGYYHIGLRIVSLAVETMTAVIAQVALPGFSRLQSDIRRLRRAFYMATRVSVTIAVPVFALLGVMAPLLIPLLFGARWSHSVPIMQVLAGLGALNAAAYFDRSALLAVGAGRAALSLTAIQATINIAAAIVTVRYGILWTAVGVTARQYVVWPMRIIALRSRIGLEVRVYLQPWILATVAALAMLAAGIAVLHLSDRLPHLAALAAVGAAGVTAYVGVMWTIGRPTLVELRSLLRRNP
jgi:O-antigen/teichoic acid export membrane protein